MSVATIPLRRQHILDYIERPPHPCFYSGLQGHISRFCRKRVRELGLYDRSQRSSIRDYHDQFYGTHSHYDTWTSDQDLTLQPETVATSSMALVPDLTLRLSIMRRTSNRLILARAGTPSDLLVTIHHRPIRTDLHLVVPSFEPGDQPI